MTDINMKLKLWIITDTMADVETYVVIAETEAEAREIWEDACDPHRQGREDQNGSYIRDCHEVSYSEMIKLELDILNGDMFDQYCPF